MEHLWWYPTIPLHDLYHTIIAEYSGSPCVGTITFSRFNVQCCLCYLFVDGVYMSCAFNLQLSPCYESTWWILGCILDSFSKLKIPKKAHITYPTNFAWDPFKKTWDHKVIFRKCREIPKFDCFPNHAGPWLRKHLSTRPPKLWLHGAMMTVKRSGKRQAAKRYPPWLQDIQSCLGRQSFLLRVFFVSWNQSFCFGGVGVGDVHSSFSETL